MRTTVHTYCGRGRAAWHVGYQAYLCFLDGICRIHASTLLDAQEFFRKHGADLDLEGQSVPRLTPAGDSLKAVGWQIRTANTSWQYANEVTAKALKAHPGFEVRVLYAVERA